MSKDDLIAFLKENLTVQVSVSRHYGQYSDQGVRVEVGVLLDGEPISSSVDYTFLD